MLINPSIKEHQLDTNQLRHQLGTNQMAPLPGTRTTNQMVSLPLPLLGTNQCVGEDNQQIVVCWVLREDKQVKRKYILVKVKFDLPYLNQHTYTATHSHTTLKLLFLIYWIKLYKLVNYILLNNLIHNSRLDLKNYLIWIN